MYLLSVLKAFAQNGKAKVPRLRPTAAVSGPGCPGQAKVAILAGPTITRQVPPLACGVSSQLLRRHVKCQPRRKHTILLCGIPSGLTVLRLFLACDRARADCN